MDENNLIWMDLEMTGLDPESERIIEMATIVTDSQLNVLAEGPVFVIKQSDILLENMDEWNTKQHNESGLVQRVRNSIISEKEAEVRTLEFIRQYIPEKKSPLCGNSVHQDRRFLLKYMPNLHDYFHYRNLDVSTLKELAKRWYPHLLEGFKKEAQHLALQDIRDSIAELKYYRKTMFIKV